MTRQIVFCFGLVSLTVSLSVHPAGLSIVSLCFSLSGSTGWARRNKQARGDHYFGPADPPLLIQFRRSAPAPISLSDPGSPS